MTDPRSDPNSFTVTWPMPVDLQRQIASIKLDYWRKVAETAAPLKDKELAAGLDRRGNPMTPISQYTRDHRKSAMGTPSPSAPPLTPAYGLSRTRSLLKWKAYLDRVVFYWERDEHAGESWGVILGYHRAGKGRLPKRDVIGLSAKATTKAKAEANKWLISKLAGKVEPVYPKGFQRVFTPRPSVKPKELPVKFVPWQTGFGTFGKAGFTPHQGPIVHIEYGVKTGVK